MLLVSSDPCIDALRETPKHKPRFLDPEVAALLRGAASETSQEDSSEISSADESETQSSGDCDDASSDSDGTGENL